MPTKIYHFPHDPEYRAELVEMPSDKRRKLLALGSQYWRLLDLRLKFVLKRRLARNATCKKDKDF